MISLPEQGSQLARASVDSYIIKTKQLHWASACSYKIALFPYCQEIMELVTLYPKDNTT